MWKKSFVSVGTELQTQDLKYIGFVFFFPKSTLYLYNLPEYKMQKNIKYTNLYVELPFFIQWN